METTHSKTGRAKKPAHKIVIPSWDSVWESFKTETEKISIEAMNADGWKTIRQASEATGINASTIGSRIRNGYFDTVQKRTLSGGCHRMVNFIRPKSLLG